MHCAINALCCDSTLVPPPLLGPEPLSTDNAKQESKLGAWLYASFGTYALAAEGEECRACDCAIAGDASNAAAPTASKITFRFDFMINLMFVQVVLVIRK